MICIWRREVFCSFPSFEIFQSWFQISLFLLFSPRAVFVVLENRPISGIGPVFTFHLCFAARCFRFELTNRFLLSISDGPASCLAFPLNLHLFSCLFCFYLASQHDFYVCILYFVFSCLFISRKWYVPVFLLLRSGLLFCLFFFLLIYFTRKFAVSVFFLLWSGLLLSFSLFGSGQFFAPFFFSCCGIPSPVQSPASLWLPAQGKHRGK